MRNGHSQAKCKIVTVAGCKGGVGKSVIACAIAIEAGRSGLDVVLVDADLGGPNMHTYLGIQSPEHVISDFLSRRIPAIEQIILKTEYPGVSFISSAGNSPSQANLRFVQKAKIMKSLSLLKSDLLIIDIGAGSSYDVMDFFSMTDGGIIVSTPEPTSIINSYGFVKNVAYRRITRELRKNSLATEILKRGLNPAAEDGIPEMRELMGELATLNGDCWLRAGAILSSFTPNIIMNKVTCESDGRVGGKLKAIIEKYLSIDATRLGEVTEDPLVKAAARKMIPFNVLSPQCDAAIDIKEIVKRLRQADSRIRQPMAMAVDTAQIEM